jgi:RNA polymerase sigma-70 factor (ECF subfamily)
MYTTSPTLLDRLRQPDAMVAWDRLVDLYTPLFCKWARCLGLQASDAQDLVQDVFLVLLRALPDFSYDPGRSFRAWLRTIFLNRWRQTNRCRRLPTAEAAEVPEGDFPGPDPIAEFTEAEYRQYLVYRALELMKNHFEPKIWKACLEHVVSGRSAAEVGRELGLSEGAVYAAKHRVLFRLRGELAGLLD